MEEIYTASTIIHQFMRLTMRRNSYEAQEIPLVKETQPGRLSCTARSCIKINQ